VTVVSAPAGSGKTVLLRSWIGAAGLAERAAWVPVGREEREPQRLWLAVLDALRRTAPGSALVRPVTAAPELDGWAIIERLLTDLEPLRDRLWLVVDDAHELASEEARRQLAAAEAPPQAPGYTAAGGEVLRTLALLEVGNAETWIGRLDDADSHLDQAVAIARRIQWPYPEFMGLVYQAQLELSRRLPRAADLSRQAIDDAERHGWTADLFAGFAANTLSAALAWQGRLDEADTWNQRAEQAFSAEADPAHRGHPRCRPLGG
jgi:tetratricopeptide (TPR) repeat protein